MTTNPPSQQPQVGALVLESSEAPALASIAQSATQSVAPSVNNFVGGQPAQPLSISSPSGGRAGGNAAIVVEVYALGRGISLAGEQGDLAGREGTFEFKANGKIFVFDPLGCAQSHWLVSSVERDVAPIVKSLDAVDQEDLAEFGVVVGHDSNPLKTVILSLPQGMGKTTIAAALAQHLGIQGIKDEWAPNQPIEPGCLHLTHLAISELQWFCSGLSDIDFSGQGIAPALAESAQSATQSVAPFTHTPRPGEISAYMPHHIWFGYPHTNEYLSKHVGILFRQNAPGVVEISATNSSPKAGFHVSLHYTAEEAECLARRLIDAAAHLRSMESKVAV
jgi:hypothetical protein